MAATHARKRTAKATKVADDSMEHGFRITLDGVSYTLRNGDLNAGVRREFRSQVGMSVNRAALLLQDDPDIDLLAAFVWLARRVNGGESALTYAEVADEWGDTAAYDIEEVKASPGPRLPAIDGGLGEVLAGS